VIANHILVSFHVAFISSVLALGSESLLKGDVLMHIFWSWDTLWSAIFVYLCFHTGIAIHELGHFLKAAKLNALNETIAEDVEEKLAQPFFGRMLYLAGMFILIPFGRAQGIKREGLNYYPDAPFNLAVAAAGPRASRNLAIAALPPAAILITVGLLMDAHVALYVGRLLLGLGCVGFLDFRQADPGKYAAFKKQEKIAKEKAATVEKVTGWLTVAPEIKRKMIDGELQRAIHPRLGPVLAPWQFRNCGMGGRHTVKEYPESNISMQEAMFLILGAHDYLEGQEMTVRLQNRLKEIIEGEEGCRVMGIGLEGGLAPYIDKGEYPLPEIRLWAMMKRAIAECGYRPGVDVAIALDPALSELEIAYREEFEMPDAVGMYLFWRDKSQLVMDREAVLEIYMTAMQEYDIPLLSIEDGFAEDDDEGWKLIQGKLGDKIFIIGDDLVTTNDRTIEKAAVGGMMNAALIKANQIGTLFETILAMLVALGKDQQLVVSHRSKSPNDDMEAQIALAVNSLGMKAGGGSNTERLVKYQSVVEQMLKVPDATGEFALVEGGQAIIRAIRAYEEPTNAGIPTVGVTAELYLPEVGVTMAFRGATPLGTSAGTGEAIHLVDALVEREEHREVFVRHGGFFNEAEPGVYKFNNTADDASIKAVGDEELTALYRRSQRYNGKGCLNAVDNVLEIIAPHFVNRNAATLTLRNMDRALLDLELRIAKRRGKVADEVSDDECIQIMQRKANLGMNAVLSVSLALSRAVGHIRGKELYELIREEMMTTIDRLASSCDVSVEGSRFEDYVVALRESNRKLEQQGLSLYQVLRDQTAIYRTEAIKPDAPTVPMFSIDEGRDATVSVSPEEPSQPSIATGEGTEAEGFSTLPASSADVLNLHEDELIAQSNRALFQAIGVPGGTSLQDGLDEYLKFKRVIETRVGKFGIVNNHVFMGSDALLVPYLAVETVLLDVVTKDGAHRVASHTFPPGAILTDALMKTMADFKGKTVDLERPLMVVAEKDADAPRINRLRDIAALLRDVNGSLNRNINVYKLRHLVARLFNLSVRSLVRAKNLQPEITQVTDELVALLNGRMFDRLPLLVRLLTRKLAILVGKPNLIDRVWNDTITLAEVQIRGSAIVNELRRSCHHSLGRRTLRLAEAYQAYMQSGDTEALVELGFSSMATADVEARSRQESVEIVERVRSDLEQLLGATESISRIKEWQEIYSETLLRCEFGKSIQEEAETLITDGIRAKNRWVFLHHLRILTRKGEDFSEPREVAEEFATALEQIQDLKPDEPAFDVEVAEKALRDAVEGFVDGIQEYYQTEPFASLQEALESYERGEYFETFNATYQLRRTLNDMLHRGGFPQLRYLLVQFDCLLEEVGYLALGNLTSVYREGHVDLDECFEVIRVCVLCTEFDGIRSRDLYDWAHILTDPSKTDEELLDVLTAIERSYHLVHQRVIRPYEKLRERLGLGEQEHRAVIANLQRTLLDLNSMVKFANIAVTYMRDRLEHGKLPVRKRVERKHLGGEAFDVLHISSREEIVERMFAGGSSRNLRDLYGGKGAGLAFITRSNIPTRDGFILPTTVGRSGIHRSDPARLRDEITKHIRTLEVDISTQVGAERRFGDAECPMLVAVRGGSVFSMPGILDSVLFVGMNDPVAEALAEHDPWQAYDSFRRFLTSYAKGVWNVNLETYNLVDEAKQRYGFQYKKDMPWEAMREVVHNCKAVLRQKGHGRELDEILETPTLQLEGAVHAVLESWNSETSCRYREIKGLCDSWHTAVIIQAMAFGNLANAEVEPGMDETVASLTGVVPGTRITGLGVRDLLGEIKFSAAGDDLVGGVIGPGSLRPLGELQELMPGLHTRLRHIVARLRRLMGTDQEVEWTVERGVLSVLQTRAAAAREDRAPKRFAQPGEPVTLGLGIRGGAFRGMVAFSDEDRSELAGTAASRDDVDGVLIVLENPTPDEIPMIISADGLLTAKGGSTSHAAIAVASVEDKDFSCVMSAAGLRVNVRKQEALIVDDDEQVLHRIHKGDIVSIHGTNGNVYIGSRKLEQITTPG